MKYYIAQQTGSVYRLYHNSLMYAPLNANNTFNDNEFAPVEEGDVDPANAETFRKFYADVRKALA